MSDFETRTSLPATHAAAIGACEAHFNFWGPVPNQSLDIDQPDRGGRRRLSLGKSNGGSQFMSLHTQCLRKRSVIAGRRALAPRTWALRAQSPPRNRPLHCATQQTATSRVVSSRTRSCDKIRCVTAPSFTICTRWTQQKWENWQFVQFQGTCIHHSQN